MASASSYFNMKMGAASKVVPVQTSPLLHLPGELRNQIYSYVLTATSGEALLFTKKEERINQLQYVCKQLRQETSHLELKLNPVVKITGTLERKNTATDRLLRFLDLLPPSKKSWLRTIILENAAGVANTIRDELPEIRWTRLRLDYFCEMNPRVQIQYRIATFSSAHLRSEFRGDVGMGIIALGWLLTQEMTDEGYPDLWPEDSFWWMQEAEFSEVQKHVSQWMSDFGGEAVMRPGSLNIRFFPMEDILVTAPFDASVPLPNYSAEARRQGFLPSWERAATFWRERGI